VREHLIVSRRLVRLVAMAPEQPAPDRRQEVMLLQALANRSARLAPWATQEAQFGLALEQATCQKGLDSLLLQERLVVVQRPKQAPASPVVAGRNPLVAREVRLIAR
jgi:hypothetical protein